jgi:hypothetical protein
MKPNANHLARRIRYFYNWDPSSYTESFRPDPNFLCMAGESGR